MQVVLGDLSRPDLKDVHQTCKALSHLAVPFLFTAAVISTFATDLHVFEAISRRPNFSHSIKTLVYDVQRFNPPSHIRVYDKLLYDQIQEDYAETKRDPDQLKSILLRVFGSGDPQRKTDPY